MTVQSIAEAVQQIDELTDELKRLRLTCVELSSVIEVLRAERDSWRAAAQ